MKLIFNKELLDPSALTPAEIAAVNKWAFDKYKTSLDVQTIQNIWSYTYGSGVYTQSMRAGLLDKSAADYENFLYTTDANGNKVPNYSLNRTISQPIFEKNLSTVNHLSYS